MFGRGLGKSVVPHKLTVLTKILSSEECHGVHYLTKNRAVTMGPRAFSTCEEADRPGGAHFVRRGFDFGRALGLAEHHGKMTLKAFFILLLTGTFATHANGVTGQKTTKRAGDWVGNGRNGTASTDTLNPRSARRSRRPPYSFNLKTRVVPSVWNLVSGW